MKPKPNQQQIRNSLVAAFNRRGIDAKELAFHLTDWLDDLEPFLDILNRPEAYTKKQIRAGVIDFVLHASAHLDSANEIILDEKEKSR